MFPMEHNLVIFISEKKRKKRKEWKIEIETVSSIGANINREIGT